MCKKSLQACRTKTDFIGYAKYKKARIVQGTHGVKIYGTKPGYAELHSNHCKELATGTRATLIKTFIAIGLALIGLALFVLPALAGG
jgi:hypothetical protein